MAVALRAELDAATAAAEQARTEADRTGDAHRAARAAADELGHRHQVMRTRLEALEQALDRGEGLTPAVRALKAAGAKLVVAGVEAQPGYERAVAAGLGWRAGAVVAERLTDALAVLAEAGGEVAVVLADTRPPAASLPPAPGARPLIELVTVLDPVAGRLLEGVWLVDDLAEVGHGVAVTRAGEGIDADRGELWRTGDAGEAAWLAARAERDHLAAQDAAAAAEHAAAAAAADRAGAEAQESGRLDELAQAALADIRSRELAAADAARAADARRDRLADEGGRCESAREAAERDLAAEAERGVALEREAARLEAAGRAAGRGRAGGRPSSRRPGYPPARAGRSGRPPGGRGGGSARAGRPLPARRRPPAGRGRAGPGHGRRIGADGEHGGRARGARPGDGRDARARRRPPPSSCASPRGRASR